jgi:hypothetical protein
MIKYRNSIYDKWYKWVPYIIYSQKHQSVCQNMSFVYSDDI